jgi:putative phosphoribosyl transferase
MKVIPYESRFSAGEIVANLLIRKNESIHEELIKKSDKFIAFAIPNGGVPVAEGFCSVLKIRYDLLIVRKIKIPYNPEAGFGSITTDGTIILNNRLLSQLHLDPTQVEDAINLTKNEIQERLKFYNKESITTNDYKDKIYEKNVFLLDDGLASGYTMLAAVKMINNYYPIKIIITVPTAPLHTIKLFDDKVDFIECPNVRRTTWFAVADAYKHWYDVPESEVKEIIQKSHYYYH